MELERIEVIATLFTKNIIIRAYEFKKPIKKLNLVKVNEKIMNKCSEIIFEWCGF